MSRVERVCPCHEDCHFRAQAVRASNRARSTGLRTDWPPGAHQRERTVARPPHTKLASMRTAVPISACGSCPSGRYASSVSGPGTLRRRSSFSRRTVHPLSQVCIVSRSSSSCFSQLIWASKPDFWSGAATVLLSNQDVPCAPALSARVSHVSTPCASTCASSRSGGARWTRVAQAPTGSD